MSDGFGTLGQKSICAKPDTLLFIDWYSVCFFFWLLFLSVSNVILLRGG